MVEDVLVAKWYRRVDRDQQFLLPVSMREWLPPDDPVWVVIETVAALDTSRLHAKRRTGGVGRAGYDPDMLLTLLIWGWAQGQRSSRRLERLCHRDVAFRIICGGDAPDHVTISRFRAECADVIAELFTQVLVLCARLGMVNVGVVALDGVKIASNASMKANRTEDGLRAALAAEAAKAADEHAATDAREDELFGDGDGERVPAPLREESSRRSRITEALADLGRENEQAAQAEVAQQQRQAEQARRREQAQQQREQFLAEYLERARRGRRGCRVPKEIEVEVFAESLAWSRQRQAAKADRPGKRGPKALPVEQGYEVVRARQRWERAVADRAAREQAAQQQATEKQAAQQQAEASSGKARAGRHCKPNPKDPGHGEPRRNITDPESRLLPLRGGGWLQGFNCQAVTSGDGYFLATGVGNSPNDAAVFPEMLDKAVAAAAMLAAHRAPAPDPTAVAAEGDEGSTSGDPATIGVLLADAGYSSEANLTYPGPDRLIANKRAWELRKDAKETPTSGAPPQDASPHEAMAHRLATPEGSALYAQRSHIAETPFAHAKHNLGFRRFNSRGHARAEAEFAFHALVHNLFKAIGTGLLTAA